MKTRMRKDKIYLQNYCNKPLRDFTANGMIKLNVYLVCLAYQGNFENDENYMSVYCYLHVA